MRKLNVSKRAWVDASPCAVDNSDHYQNCYPGDTILHSIWCRGYESNWREVYFSGHIHFNKIIDDELRRAKLDFQQNENFLSNNTSPKEFIPIIWDLASLKEWLFLESFIPTKWYFASPTSITYAWEPHPCKLGHLSNITYLEIFANGLWLTRNSSHRQHTFVYNEVQALY